MPLKRVLRGSDFFTLSFGAIVGVGWIVVLGTWLSEAGPAGAILAFIAGGLVTLSVGCCYAEMGALYPVSGGEGAYTYEIFGVKACFVTGWFLTLNFIATIVFEAVSVSWVADILTPGIRGPILYTIRGEAVYLGSTLLGIGGMVLITVLNYQGIRPASALQNLFTYVKIALAVVVIFVGITWGKISNLEPLVVGGSSGTIWSGVLSVFVVTPFFLAGFNTVSQLMEEKHEETSLKTVSWMIILSIGAATLFYCLVIFAVSMTMPRERLLQLNLPAAMAFDLLSPYLYRTVLVVALLGNITCWNSNFLSGTRILFALGRAEIASHRLCAVNAKTGAPGISVLFVGVMGCLGVLLGRGAILRMANLASTCFAVAYLLVCWGVVVHRRRKMRHSLAYRLPGGTATAMVGVLASLLILFLSLYLPYVDSGKLFPIEWGLLLVWGGIGVLFWTAGKKSRSRLSEDDRRRKMFNNAPRIE